MPPPYKIIMSDPPWRFQVWDRVSGTERAPDFHYDTMEDQDLTLLPVKEWVDKDAVLIMWVYDPHYPFAFELAKAWGFDTYVTVLFRWLKSANGQLRMFDTGERLNYGLGYHTRGGGCEEAWLFKRGKGLKVLNHSIRKEFYSNVREHSRKPDEVPGWIIDLYGDVPRLDMFTRTRREGWDAFGNETDKFKSSAIL